MELASKALPPLPMNPSGCGAGLTADELQQRQVDAANRIPGNLTGYDCRKCLNRGYIEELRGSERVMRECSCMKARQSLRRIEASGLKYLLDDMTFDKFQTPEDWQKDRKKMAQRYVAEGRGKWFAILGQSGSGKTHICTAICGELLKKGYAVRYLEWVPFVRRVERLRFKHAEYEDYINPIKTVEVLYIDDLFKRVDSDFAYSVAFELVDYREKAGLDTIISGEMSIDQIGKQDVALAGRIKYCCGGFLSNCPPEAERNWRLRK